MIVITAKQDIDLEDFAGYDIANLLRKPLLPVQLIEAIEVVLA